MNREPWGPEEAYRWFNFFSSLYIIHLDWGKYMERRAKMGSTWLQVKHHSLLSLEMDQLNLAYHDAFLFLNVGTNRGELAILIVINVSFCGNSFSFLKSVSILRVLLPKVPSPESCSRVGDFSLKNSFFSVQNFNSNSYAKKGQEMRHFSCYPSSYSWIMVYITSIVCPQT